MIFKLLENLKDPKSLSVKEFLLKSSNLESSVLLFGETGTGKDFWAEYLFKSSGREKFVNINCGDVPENLLESEWFGYKKGAFSGAQKDFDGRWSLAGNGILFLNQIDMLNPVMQSRLLRVLERRTFYSLGSTEEKKIRARIIFSADSDIKEKVKKGVFRSDLYFRISSLSVFIPPLRERKKDILPLLNYFANEKNVVIDLSPSGEKIILRHPWMGNIRELQNFVQKVSITKKNLTDSDAISLLSSQSFSSGNIFEDEPSLSELEKRYIEHLLKQYDNKSEIARIMKISRKSLYNKIKKYGKN